MNRFLTGAIVLLGMAALIAITELTKTPLRCTDPIMLIQNCPDAGK